MSMHLVGPHMTTTKYNRKHRGSKSKRLAKAKTEHDEFLRSMGVHPDQLAEKKAKRKDVKAVVVSSNVSRDTSNSYCDNNIPGVAPRKDRQQYTGDYIIGIATTHKSNLMPVTSRKQAGEASKMRR